MNDNLEEPRASKFANLVPFESKEFYRAFEVAMEATADISEELDPTKKRFVVEEEDGSLGEYRFADHPIARSSLAVAKLYAGEPEKAISVNMRLAAMFDLVEDDEFERWRVKVEDGHDLHKAVIDAAAVVPLTDDGVFPKPKFVATVEKIIKTDYAD